MENKIITLAIADDELLFRRGLISILSKHEHLVILFDADNGKDLIDKLRSSKTLPEIIITDLKMPQLNGVEVTKLIRKEFPAIKVIALTSYFRKSFIMNMISIGAAGYLDKNSTPALMVETIEEVSKVGYYYDSKVMKFIHESIANPNHKKIKSKFDTTFFTRREKEVLQLICQQKTTNEIAKALNISPRTVEGHRNSLQIKTESKNIAGLVIYAIEHKLITLSINQL